MIAQFAKNLLVENGVIKSNDPMITKNHLDPDSDDEVLMTEEPEIFDITGAVILLDQIGLCKYNARYRSRGLNWLECCCFN